MKTKNDETADSLSASETAAHLDKGYQNAQSVVRFFDAKIGVLIGVWTTVMGLVIVLVNWALAFQTEFWGKIDDWGGAWGLLPLTLALSTIAAFGFAVRSLWMSFGCLIPRELKGEPSTLFVVLSTKKGADNSAMRERIELFRSGAVGQDAVEDHTRQLRRMGEIVWEKHTHCKKAFFALKWMLLSASGCSCIALLLRFVVTGFFG